jgi:hypothetical protein
MFFVTKFNSKLYNILIFSGITSILQHAIYTKPYIIECAFPCKREKQAALKILDWLAHFFVIIFRNVIN